MDLGRTLSMNEMEYKSWRFITAEHIREEVINVLGDENIVTLKVDVTLATQTPPFASAPPTKTPTASPAPSYVSGATLEEEAAIAAAAAAAAAFGRTPTPAPADTASMRSILLGDLRNRQLQQTQNSYDSLKVLFDVEILLRSPEENHDVGRYIGGAFNSVDDKQSYIVDLRLTQQEAFDNTISVDVVVPDVVPTQAPTSAPVKASTSIGLIIGMVVVAVSGLALGGFFLYTRRRKRRIQSDADNKDPPSTNIASTNEGRTYAGEIHMQDDDEVSNLTDPYGMGSRVGPGGEGSTVGDTIENYEFWRTYRANQTVTSNSHEGSENNILVEEDDDTLRVQYLEEDKFEVDAPAGLLGLVLEQSISDGVPTVHAIKTTSPLSDSVQVGDRLVSVDGDDVTILLASDVSRLISEKRNQPIRRFVFSRPGSGTSRGLVVPPPPETYVDEEAPAVDIHNDDDDDIEEPSTLGDGSTLQGEEIFMDGTLGDDEEVDEPIYYDEPQHHDDADFLPR